MKYDFDKDDINNYGEELMSVIRAQGFIINNFQDRMGDFK